MKVSLAAILGGLFFINETFLGRWRRSSKAAGGTQADGGTMRMLWLTAYASIAAGVLVALWPLGPRLSAGFPWRTASVAVFALGVVLRWWAIIYLGRFFTVDVAVAPDHQVVDTGPYRLARHPSYTGLLMMYLGWALTLNNVVALPVVLVPVTLSLLRRIHVEEAVLTNALGEPYVAYSRRTKRLIPLLY